MKIEDKLNLSEDRGQISKIEDSPLKNQADGQPSHIQHVNIHEKKKTETKAFKKSSQMSKMSNSSKKYESLV